MVLVACSLVVAAILITLALTGSPTNAAAQYALLALFIAAAIIFLHTLVTRILPVSTRRDRHSRGITERGIAPGVTPDPPYGTTGFDVHLTDDIRD